jgi:hypothetical protein
VSWRYGRPSVWMIDTHHLWTLHQSRADLKSKSESAELQVWLQFDISTRSIVSLLQLSILRTTSLESSYDQLSSTSLNFLSNVFLRHFWSLSWHRRMCHSSSCTRLVTNRTYPSSSSSFSANSLKTQPIPSLVSSATKQPSSPRLPLK